jgi:hypothetical protein
MSDDAFATCNGNRVSALRLVVDNVGPWFAELDLETDPGLSGRVKIKLGDLELTGTVIPQQDGTFGVQQKCRVVGGAGGWGKLLAPKPYHNDSGIKARLIAEDAAREVGETLGGFTPAAERVGVDYVRGHEQLAASVLEQVSGGVAWWVDYAGVTQVGPRPATPLDASAYEVLAFDPRSRLATLAVDNPSSVKIGSIISERLEAPQTVRDLELTLTGGKLRVVAWCGGSESEAGRLGALFRAIAQRVTDAPLIGKYRYRVVAMASDGRVELQAVRKGAGLPDVKPISQWPGVAGTHADLTPGAEVLVEFIEGDRSMPIVTAYAGKGGAGFIPVQLYVGGDSGPEAARNGDAVKVSPGVAQTITLAGGGAGNGTYTFTFSPVPVPGSVSPEGVLLGEIVEGSSKVRIAT